ncbi:hypothetical protein Dimus_032684 [Dionaea muscipula]
MLVAGGSVRRGEEGNDACGGNENDGVCGVDNGDSGYDDDVTITHVENEHTHGEEEHPSGNDIGGENVRVDIAGDGRGDVSPSGEMSPISPSPSESSLMGSGHWFKTIIRRNKGKDGKSRKSTNNSAAAGKPNETISSNSSQEDVLYLTNGAASQGISGTTHAIPVEDLASIRIQTAYRAYKARKTLQRIRGAKKLQIQLTEGETGKKQSLSTLTHLHSWSRIQLQIRERRLGMVLEGRLKKKKLENQLKLEAKLHDLELEWCNGSETMEEILARIHQREEAAVKRERALAYAFTHQWQAKYSSQTQGVNVSELGKASWGWSWKERWIAARPWESRVTALPFNGQKKGQKKPAVKACKDDNVPKAEKSPPPVKPNGKKELAKARRSSFPGAVKPSKSEANTGGATRGGRQC